MTPIYARHLVLLLSVFLSVAVNAQNFNIDEGGTVSSCDGFFYDPGGPSAPFGSNVGNPFTMTICPDGTTGSSMRAFFAFLSLNGTLEVFNGPNTAAPILLTRTGEDGNSTFEVRATASNPSGCLTFRYEGSGGDFNSGWEASLNCVTDCQPIVADITSTVPSLTTVNGEDYLDACPGDEITLSGSATFPENNAQYAQSIGTSIFTWTFQDGTSQTGQTITHTYEEGGGYEIELTVTDTRKCRNSPRVIQRARISPSPRYDLTAEVPDDLCPGEELIIDISGSSDSDFGATPIEQVISFTPSQTFSELVLLPDGNGVVYSTPLEFIEFQPDQTLQSGDQILEICIEMEHSYVGDLGLWLICPSGNRLDLVVQDLEDNAIGRQRLGKGQRITTYSDTCGSYCWTALAPRTLDEVIIQDGIGRDERVPDGDFSPEGGSFSDLVGCPLNGAWSLNILDNEPQDNGSICSWSIRFRADVFLNQPEFTFPIRTVEIVDNLNFESYTSERAILRATNAGPKQVRFATVDSLSCGFDTTFVIGVSSPLDPACYDCGIMKSFQPVDTSVCPGDELILDFSSIIPPDTTIVWEAIDVDDFSNALNPDRDRSYGSPISVGSQNPATVGAGGTTIEAVCVNLNNDGDLADITLELESPDGTRLTLLTGGGGNGEDLFQTCFSPTATQAFTAGSAPYTGTFRSSVTNWATFAGDRVNGDWTLHAWDRGGNDVSQLLRWSIALRHERDIDYSWSPDPSLSCTDCPNPTIIPTEATDYELTIRTAEGCERTIPVSVDFNALTLETTDVIEMVSCNGGSDGSIAVTVTNPIPSVTYAWQDDPTESGLSRSGLVAGDYVLVATDMDGCMVTLEFELTEPDELTVTVGLTSAVTCFGGNDGSLTGTPAGGTEPYTILWDDPAASTGLTAENLPAGTYTIRVTDAENCVATATGVVTQPDQLIVTATATPVICRGDNNGTATANTVGGTETYSFSWSNGRTTETITDLPEGNFSVTVTDENGCTSEDMVTVNEPDEPLVVSAVQDAAGCAGASANTATVTALGGMGDFTFAWANGETTATAVALDAGLTTVTVTDGGGCARETSIIINELAAITIDLADSSPSCNNREDGSLTATPVGGNGVAPADYTYLWSNGAETRSITDLPGGLTYGVTVTDAGGCTGEASFDLAIPPPIVIEATGGRTSCFDTPDGSLTLADITGPNGGPYQILWASEAGGSTGETVNNLAADTFGVLITDPAGCTLDTLLIVTEPDSLQAAAEQINVSCNGNTDGILLANPVGGTGPYTFQWSTSSGDRGIADLPIGEYTLSLTDANGCLTETDYTITEPDLLVALPEADSVLCLGEFNGAITVIPSGGTGPFLYTVAGRGTNRSNRFVGLEAGDYAVTVTDENGCVADTVAMVPDGEFFGIDAGPDTSVVFGDSIRLFPIVNGGVGQLTYTVTPSSPTFQSCIICPSPTLIPQFPVDVTYRVTDENGCQAEDMVRISVPRIREVAVPTGFSPDDNNINDLLLVHGRPGTRVVLFQIFDRWANILFEVEDFAVNDPNIGWDGKEDGNPVNAGVYLYKLVVEYDDFTRETLSGQTTLIR